MKSQAQRNCGADHSAADGETRLRGLAQFPEQNPNPVLRLGFDGSLLYANPAAMAWLRDCVGGEPPQVPAGLCALAAEAATSQKVINAELAVGSGNAFRFDALRPQGEDYVNLYGYDITPLKKAEEALRRSRAQVAWVLDQTGVGTWFNTLPLGRLSWDEQTRKLFFVPPGVEPSIELFWSRLHPDDREPTRLAIERALRDRTLYEMDHRAVHPETGQVRWIRSVGQATYAPDGTPVRFDGINYDLTQRKTAEVALRRSERRYRSFVEVTSQFAWVTDRNGQVVEDIPALRKFTGQTYEEARGAGWAAALHPDDLQRTLEVWSRAVAARKFYEVEYRMRRHDGVYRLLLARGVPIMDEQGEVEEWVGTCMDITERREAEAALQASEARYRTVAQFTYDWEYWRSPENRFLYVSPSCKRVTGYGAEEFIEDPALYLRIVHADDRERVAAHQRNDLSHPAQCELEFRIVRRDGQVRWIAHACQLVNDAQGRFLGRRAANRDVTDRKQAEQALRESESFYRQTLESIPGMVFTTRPDGYCDYQSQPWVEFTGIPMSEHLGDGWNKLLHPDDRPRAFAAWQAAVEGRAPYDLEYRVRRHDGAYEWFKVRGRPIRDASGQIVRWFGTALNIEALKRTEAQLRASLREKEVLLQEIHHRVKNNLQVISSLINLQAATIPALDLQAVLQDVRDRVRTMALVHEKLYQSGDLAQLDFAEYITGLLRYLWRAHGAAAARVRLTLDLHAVPLPVDAAVPCGLILNELATNALKHGFHHRSEGEVTVGLSLDAATRRVCLRVRDNGNGLPPDLNWRESPSLGLRLVQMLAQQLQGTVETGPPPGAEFRVVFPLLPKP